MSGKPIIPYAKEYEAPRSRDFYGMAMPDDLRREKYRDEMLGMKMMDTSETKKDEPSFREPLTTREYNKGGRVKHGTDTCCDQFPHTSKAR